MTLESLLPWLAFVGGAVITGLVAWALHWRFPAPPAETLSDVNLAADDAMDNPSPEHAVRIADDLLSEREEP